MGLKRLAFVLSLLGVALSLLALFLSVRVAFAEDEQDVRGAIYAAAELHGVGAESLIRLVNCESRFVPSARGDRGHSHGIAQLSDLPGTGLLAHFYQVGYDNAYDYEQASDYLARVRSGEWAAQGVTLRRWSCYGGD